MKIVTAISAFNAPVDTANTDNQSVNVLFNSRSASSTSHAIDVSETAVLVRAFGLTGGQTITVHMLGNDGITNVNEILVLHGKTIQLSVTNTALILDMPGRYVFVLSAGLGTVSCTCIETGISYWSWGLKAFAEAT
jgi:hypothetical protein